jgi:hypothetical protein
MSKQTSEYIKDFNDFIRTINKDYTYYSKVVNDCDKETQDYLHQLELGEYKERGKTATKLTNCRKRRREAKDMLAVITPVKDWIDKSQGALKILPQLIGAVRIKERDSKRYYYPRIVEDLPIGKN